MKNVIGFLMYVTVAMLLFSVVSGCAQIKERNLRDDIQRAADITQTVCGVAELLAAQGADIPGVEQCDRILARLNREEMQAVIAIVGCRDEANPQENPAKFAECAAKEGWPVIKKKMKKLSNSGSSQEPSEPEEPAKPEND